MDLKEAVEELRGFESAPWEYGCSTAIQQAVVTLIDFVRNAEALAGALQECLDVLTEPGMMDVDEWKAWKKRAESLGFKALRAHEEGK